MTTKRSKSKSNFLVAKDNQLMEAKFQFSLWEMRIFERMISSIEKEDTDFYLNRLYIKDLMRFFNTKNSNDNNLIRNAANSLGDKKLLIPYYDEDGEKRWAKITVFPTVTIPDRIKKGENAYIELKFHEDLKGYLLELKNRFKLYDIRNLCFLKSVYSIRMYILLKQYEKIGIRKFTIDELRDLLAIEPGKYQLYADFKKRVIVKPQKELEKFCDIRFEFTEEKAGRRVAALRFKIIPNQVAFMNAIDAPMEQVVSQNLLPTPVEKQVDMSTIEVIYDKIGKYEITKEVIKKWLENYPKEQVINAVKYTLTQISKGVKISNVAGYLHKMVQEPQISISVAAPGLKHKTSTYQKELAKKVQQEADQEQQGIAYEAQINKITQTLAEQYPEIIAEIQVQAVAKARAILPTATIENQIAKAHFNRLIKERFKEAFVELV